MPSDSRADAALAPALVEQVFALVTGLPQQNVAVLMVATKTPTGDQISADRRMKRL